MADKKVLNWAKTEIKESAVKGKVMEIDGPERLYVKVFTPTGEQVGETLEMRQLISKYGSVGYMANAKVTAALDVASMKLDGKKFSLVWQGNLALWTVNSKNVTENAFYTE